jgi:non-heme Fe2+,alpha-ketoglutarate-dependent halogenase
MIEQTCFDLTEEELKQFHENGYLGPITLCEPEEMKEIWSKVRYELNDRSHAAYQLDIGYTGATNIANYDRHLDINLLSKHISNPKITHRVRSILGPDLLCWRTEFFPKYKGDEGTDWHQADTFANASGSPQILWPEEYNIKAGQGTITVWTAFTDATLKNGCLQFIPGTHKHMFYDESKVMQFDPNKINAMEKDGMTRGFFGYDYRDLQIDPNWRPDESKAESMVMKAGQCIIFWSTLMHASLPNTSTVKDMRMGFATRYVPTKVRVYPNTQNVSEYGGDIPLDRFGCVLVTGQDNYQHNTIIDKNLRGYPFYRS